MQDKEAIVCDGAVRSGKTLAMGLGFFLWAMASFDGQRFGVCGKTISSLRRNVLSEILPRLEALGAKWKERRTEHLGLCPERLSLVSRAAKGCLPLLKRML